MINGPFMRKAMCMTRLPQTTLGFEALLKHTQLMVFQRLSNLVLKGLNFRKLVAGTYFEMFVIVFFYFNSVHCPESFAEMGIHKLDRWMDRQSDRQCNLFLASVNLNFGWS